MIKKDKILAYALENALLHKGQAKEDSVLPKLFMEGLKRSDISKVVPQIKEIVNDVNKMTFEQQEEKFRQMEHLVKKVEHKEREGLQDLPDAKKGKVVLRIEPSPTGPLHVGHCLVLGLNYLYKKKYDGKLIVRISDTNPESIDKNAYKDIAEDANWVTGNGVDEIKCQSDNLEKYYKIAEKLIELGKAYVCKCSSETFKEYVSLGRACPCRHNSARKNMQEWKKMFKEYNEEQAVLRIKTDLKAKNPALREWPAFRICDTEHPRTKKKYRVWPLMNFAVAVDDIEQGMTHVIRGKDHIVNTERQKYIYKYLYAKEPVFIHIGKINFEGIHLSTRGTAQAIKDGNYAGWDDIRLPFLAALRKRGLNPKSLLAFAEKNGISPVDKTMPFEDFMLFIYSLNKPYVEDANRYFFAADAIKIKVKNAPKLNIEIPLHPQKKEKGMRKFKTGEEFYISKKDYETLKEGEVFRLMNLFNFERKGKDFVFHSHEHNPELRARMIHWVPSDSHIKTKVLMLNGKYAEGYAEQDTANTKQGDIVQFERFGFCRFIKKSKDELEFWFTQR